MSLVSIRIAICNFPPYVHAHEGGTNFYGPWINSVLETLSDNVAISWIFLQAEKCTQRDMTELLCSDTADIAIHPMLIGSMDRQCLEWSHPLDCTGMVTVDTVRTSPQALLFAPFTTFTWIMYAITVVCLICSMVVLDKKGRRRRHVLRGSMALSGQLDVPDDVHVSIYIVYITFGIFTMLILSVYTADLASYLLNQVDQPATKLKSLIDSNTNFYVMTGAVELQMEMDQGPLTARLRGDYSIVSDPETQLKPIVVPYMMSRKMELEQCGPLRLSYDEMPSMPLGIALRSGFAMNAQIQKRLRQRVLTGRFNDDMKAWIRTKYACDEGESGIARPSLSVMWPVFVIAYVGMGIAFTSRVAPYVYTTRIHPMIMIWQERIRSRQ
jgi:hypothetical protein